MDKETENFLKNQAKEIRKLTIEEIGNLGTGHIGGAMSIVDLLTLLYFHRMKVDPKNPRWEERDQLVVSKGHSGPAVYATLALKGFFPLDWLKTLNRGGTKLPSHCDRNKTPGIDMTTGSLGQGFSAAIGIAVGLKMDKKNFDRVYRDWRRRIRRRARFGKALFLPASINFPTLSRLPTTISSSLTALQKIFLISAILPQSGRRSAGSLRK